MTEECCFECHLTPLPPQWPLVHPGQHSLSHIFTAKQEWLPLLLCLNLISSLLLSNSPITLLLSSPFFLPAIQNLKRKNASPPVKNTGMSGYSERDCWGGKKGLLCLRNAEWETLCGFWTDAYERCNEGTLQTYIWTEKLNSLSCLLKSSVRGSPPQSVRLNSHRDCCSNFWLVWPDAIKSLFIFLCTSSVLFKLSTIPEQFIS